MQTTLGLVGAGLGITLTSASASGTRQTNLRYVPLRDCGDVAVTEMLWHPRTESAALRELIAAAREWVAHPEP